MNTNYMKKTASRNSAGFRFAQILFSLLIFSFSLVKAQTYGTISTYAGGGVGDNYSPTSAELSGPDGVARDASGNIYIADKNNNRIRKVSTTGIITTIAGTGTAGYSGDGGQATAAEIKNPVGVAVDASGDVYFADNGNFRIREIAFSGIISTVAGNGTVGNTGNNNGATIAEIDPTGGIGIDPNGNIYITDNADHVVRKISGGIIYAFAGNGTAGESGNGGLATAAELNFPAGVGADNIGNIYIADENANNIRVVNSSGTISAFAGTGTQGYSGDGGQATAAELILPNSVAVDVNNNVYILEQYRVRKVTGGIISTIAGNGSLGYTGDGGPATAAEFDIPFGIAVDGTGDAYISDDNNQRVRLVSSSGIISTFAGSRTANGDGATSAYLGISAFSATSSSDQTVSGIITDPSGDLFIADCGTDLIQKVNSSGTISVIAGTGAGGYSGDGGSATAALINIPTGIVQDASGNTYIADFANSRIREISAGGTISTLAGNGTQGFSGNNVPATLAELKMPAGLAIDGSGNIYIADTYNHAVRKVATNGYITTLAGGNGAGYGGDGSSATATTAKLNYPTGVSVDPLGNVYIADYKNNRIRMVNTSGIISTVAGSATAGYSGDGNAATTASLNNPTGVMAKNGEIFIADYKNNRIRRVNSSGIISTIAGNGTGGYSGDGNSPTAAELNLPSAITTDAAGNLYIADNYNSRIRKLNNSCSMAASVTASTNVTCNGGNNGSATVTVTTAGTPPYSYAWAPSGGTTHSASNLTAGSYTCTVTDVNGCTSMAPTTINQPTALFSFIFTSSNPTCSGGNNGSAYDSVQGGTPPYTYSWAPSGGTTHSASNLTAGTYTCSITDANGCTATTTVTISNPAPVTVVVTPSVTAICPGNQANLTASGASVYNWAPTTGLNNPTSAAVIASPASTTTYTINATSANGCPGTATITVTVNANPTVSVSAAPSFTICAGGSTVITATGANNYSWIPATGLSSTLGTNVTASPTTTTTYSVTGTNAAGCWQEIGLLVTVNPLPSTPTASSNSPVCTGSSINLTTPFGSGESYSWNGPGSFASTAQNPSISSAATTNAGTYSVTVTNTVTGCASAPGTITVAVNPSPTVSISGPNSVCNGSGATLTATGATTYSWSSGATTAAISVTPTMTTTYTVTGTSGGCSNVTTQTMTINALPSVSVSATPTIVCAGNSSALSATGANSYTWSPTVGLSATTGQSVTAAPPVTTTYTVTGTNASGCINTATVTITVNPLPSTPTASSNSPVCGGSPVNLTASTVVGTTYSWTGPNGFTSTAQNPTNTNNDTVSAGGLYFVTVTNTITGCSSTASTSVSINPSPTVTITGPSSVCNGSSATLTASGATSYAWSSGVTTAAISVNPTMNTTYTVTGTSSGCSNTATQSVTVNAAPNVVVIPQNAAICPGSSVSLAASGANTYTWSPPNGLSVTTGANVTANPTVTTTYTVTGTNAAGCAGTRTVPITINPVPVLTVSSTNPLCNGSTGTATANPSGGTPPYTYSWSSGATSSSITANAGVYNVSVTDNNGCKSAPDSAIITQPAAVAIKLNTVNESCNGLTNGNITANVTGGTPGYKYSWNNGGTKNIIINLATGAYSVTVTDANGCSSVASTTVTQPAAVSVTASSTNASCGGDNGTATATGSGGVIPYNYTWNTTPAQNGASISDLAAGSYTVVLTDATGCTANANVTISSSGGPVISPSVTNSTCGASNGSASVTVSGGTPPYRYSWSNGDTLANDNNLAASTYVITVTDAFGCQTFEAVNVTDAGGPAITVSSVTNVVCNSNSTGAINISVSGGTAPYQYSWSNAATTQNISGLTAGPYQVTVIDASGCTVIDNVTVTQPNELVLTTSTTYASCAGSDGGASVTVSGGVAPYTYSWSTGSTATSISNVPAGTYFVTVTDNNSCNKTTLASVTNAAGPLVTLDSVVDENCSNSTLGHITISATGGTPPYTYLWSNGDTTQDAFYLNSGNYNVTVTDAAGCKGTNGASITTALPPGISICMVTVDPATNFNTLLWDANGTHRIYEYIIYRESTTPGLYNIIGNTPGIAGKYVDTVSNADKRSWGYEISELDSCGQASPISQSILFKTIHLTATVGSGNSVNLVWDNFEGATFSHYIIYRDSVAGIASDSIASVSTNTFGYVDNPSITKNWYYHIGIGGALGCADTGGHRSNHGVNYNSSKSNTGNIIFVAPTSLSAISSVNSLDIYPNPTRGTFNMTLNLNKQQNVMVKVYDALGQMIEADNCGKQAGNMIKKYDFSAFSKGVYTLQVTTDDGVLYRKVVIQ